MWGKTAQKAEISQMSIFGGFFEDTGSPVSEPAGFTAVKEPKRTYKRIGWTGPAGK